MQRAGESAHRRQMYIRGVTHAEEEAAVVHNPGIEDKRTLVPITGVLGPAHQIGVVT